MRGGNWGGSVLAESWDSMDKRFTILMPIHSFEPGGVERVGLNLARSWQDAGHEVIVLLGRDEGQDRAIAPRLRYERQATRLRTARFETAWMIWCLLHFLRRNRVDAIFCAGNTYAIVCAAARLFLGQACPPIIAKISNDLERKDKSPLRRRLYHVWLALQGLLFDRFVAMAGSARNEILRYMRIPAHRTAVVPDPALTEARLQRLLAIPRTDAARNCVNVLAIGRLVPQKNFALLIEAFAQGSRPGDTLTLVGEGPLRAELEDLVRQLSLSAQVRFTGHLTCVDAMLERADCLVLSSNYEGVPAVAIEAIAAGLPVIATDCSQSMAELLGHGRRGALLAVGDRQGLAERIAAARSLKPLCPEQRRFAAAFVVEEARDSYLQVIREAVAAAQDDWSIYLPSTMRHSPIRGV